MFKSKKEIEVRYAETDQMGIVYHANYLVWMELGRTQFVKDLGFQYADMEKQGVLSPVLEANITYKKAMKYGETAVIYTWIEEYSPLKTRYGYEIHNDAGELCIQATTLHVCVKKENFRPISLKKHFPEWHEAYEKAYNQ